ncbi:MAG TPA: hypothetical protein VFO89_03205, partial [Thermoanaerobaculia bacterium]|nr:hypothetical protein [Thermoanaerobaculia bacterium]
EQAGIARRQIHRLNVALSYLLESLRDSAAAAEPAPVEHLVAARVAQHAETAREAYVSHDYAAAARALLAAIEDVASYARWCAGEIVPGERGGSRTAIVTIIDTLADGFSPVCPFILGRFAADVRAMRPSAPAGEGWAYDLVTLLARKGRPIQIGGTDVQTQSLLNAHAATIRALLGLPLEVIPAPSREGDVEQGAFFRRFARRE